MGSNVETSFLGTGWSFPPTFSRVTYSVDMVGGEADIRESLWILFSTSLGERVMVPNYGSQLGQMVFQSLTTTLLRQMEDYVNQAVLFWEPRVDVAAVTAQPDATAGGTVWITLEYVVRQTNTRNNLVYPFYFQEGTIPVQP